MPAEQALFYLFGALALAASLFVVGQRNPMYSVLLLIASFAALAGIYVLLDAPFVAVIQIIIYAGAIMVLFLFVVMLLNAPREEAQPMEEARPPGPTTSTGAGRLGALVSVLMGLELIWALSRAAGRPSLLAERDPDLPAGLDSVREIGLALFTDYAFAFEVTSILIIVAMVGAVVLAKREV